MGASLTASEHDLRTLAGIVSDQRSDLPDEGVPLSLLSDLKSQIPCDYVLFQGYDPRRNSYWFAQEVSGGGEDPYSASDEPSDQTFWEHFWNCKPCSYPDRTGDVRSIVQIADFYSA